MWGCGLRPHPHICRFISFKVGVFSMLLAPPAGFGAAEDRQTRHGAENHPSPAWSGARVRRRANRAPPGVRRTVVNHWSAGREPRGDRLKSLGSIGKVLSLGAHFGSGLQLHPTADSLPAALHLAFESPGRGADSPGLRGASRAGNWERDERGLVPERNTYLWWMGLRPKHHGCGSLLRARGLFITLLGCQTGKARPIGLRASHIGVE